MEEASRRSSSWCKLIDSNDPNEPTDLEAGEDEVWQTEAPVSSGATFDPTRLLDMVGQDGSLADALLEMVLVDNPVHLAQLAAAVKAEDPAAVRQVAHKLKGGLLSICGDRASACAAALEKAGREERVADFAPWLAELEHETVLLGQVIAEYRAAHASPPA